MPVLLLKNLYCLEADYSYRHELLAGIEFKNDWCVIRDGKVTVRQGYAWDGCSPKWDVAGLGIVGVPDGRPHLGRPITYRASLVHDVFCQFRGQIPITKSTTIQVWSDMLAEREFSARLMYVTAVDLFGPQRFAGDC